MKTLAGDLKGHIPGIDGLRAIAVLSVILFHMRASFLPGGFTGVDIFFVVSGYVVSASLGGRKDTGFGTYLTGFYERRMVRILPALFACLLVTALAKTLFIPNSWLSQTANYTGLASVFGLSNIALIWYSDGYFSPRAEFNPFTHTWSLAVEEQFYLVFPLIFFLWLRQRNASAASRKAFIGRMALPLLLLASLGYSVYESAHAPERAYYLLPSRFWELASGALLYQLHHAGKAIPRSGWQIQACGLGGIALLAWGFVMADPRQFPFPWAIPSVLGAVLLIAASVADPQGASPTIRLLCQPVARYIGKISYSLYLWHWPVLVLLRWTTGLDSPLILAAAGLATFALAAVSFHVVEQGSRRLLTNLRWTSLRTVLFGIGTATASVVVLGVLLKAQSFASLSVTRDTNNWYPIDWQAVESRGPAPDAGQAKARTVDVIGDSHTGAYATMLQQLKKDTGTQVHFVTRGGCPVAGLLYPMAPRCKPILDDVFQEVEKNTREGDIVFLASLRVPRLADQWEVSVDTDKVPSPEEIQKTALQRARAVEEADSLITRLEKSKLRVVIDAPKPVFASPPFRCSDWFNAHNPVCAAGFSLDKSFMETHRRPTMDALGELQRRHPQLTIWDPFPILCPKDNCSAFDGSLPLFFDGDHLSAHGNRVLYPAFAATINPFLQQ